jgi:hypothetical protein
MMKRLSWAVAALLLGGVGQSRGELVIVNFDDLHGQAGVPDGYGGINWGGNWTYYDFDQPPYNPHSGLTRIYNSQPGNFDYITDDPFAFANGPVQFNGAWFAGNGVSVRFDLYDNGVLVHQSADLTTSATPTFLDSGYSGLVDRVVVHDYGFDGYVMDDVTYTTTPVPEPSTLTLVGLGTLGLLGYGWRRKQAAA